MTLWAGKMTTSLCVSSFLITSCVLSGSESLIVLIIGKLRISLSMVATGFRVMFLEASETKKENVSFLGSSLFSEVDLICSSRVWILSL